MRLADVLNDDGFTVAGVKSTAHPEGKTYRIPAPDIATGQKLAGLMDIAGKMANDAEVTEADVRRLHLDDDEEREFSRMVLGTAYDELLADGVPWPTFQRISRWAFLAVTLSEDQANDPKMVDFIMGKTAAPANRSQRRKKAKTTR